MRSIESNRDLPFYWLLSPFVLALTLFCQRIIAPSVVSRLIFVASAGVVLGCVKG